MFAVDSSSELSRIGRRAARGLVAAMLLATAIVPGCKKQEKPAVEANTAKPIDYSAELPPGQLALRKIGPEEYPDFGPGWNERLNLSTSIDQSLIYLTRPSSRTFYPYLDISHERAQASLRALRDVAERSSSPSDFDAQIRDNFEVYKSIGAPDPSGQGYTDRVLFTGYFTPIYDASLTRQGPYQYPLYRRPKDLVSDRMTGDVKGRDVGGGATTPYYTRREIESGGVLAGQEIAWVKDRFEAYVITIQGSAILKLPDGQRYEIGFAGHNGYDYTSIGKKMIEAGVLRKEDLNLKKLREFFATDPSAYERFALLNDRFVFFTETRGGPFGSLNVPVTTMKSIATDKAVYPRAMPSFLAVDVPWSDKGFTRPYRGFMMDQDTGGAIRAAGRTDIFMGIGADAEALAGHQLHEGELYYIAVKPERLAQWSQPTPIELAQRGGRGPQMVSAKGPGSRSVINVDDVQSGSGPQTDSLPVRDSRGPPPPGGWPKVQ